jgi:hypothetical protein
MAGVDTPFNASRVKRIQEARQRPTPRLVQRDRQARLYLNPRRRSLQDRFGHLKAVYD